MTLHTMVGQETQGVRGVIRPAEAFTDVMIDIETLGTRPGYGIIEIGYAVFSRRLRAFMPIMPEMNHGVQEGGLYAIPVMDNLLHGFEVDQDTIRWWKEEQQYKGAPNNKRYPHVTMAQTLAQFAQGLDHYWFDGLKDAWCKGTDFDFPMLKAAYDKLGVTRPIVLRNENFRYLHDFRTLKHAAEIQFPELKDLKCFKDKPNHNAMGDAMLQAEQATNIFAYMNSARESLSVIGAAVQRTAQEMKAQQEKKVKKEPHATRKANKRKPAKRK